MPMVLSTTNLSVPKETVDAIKSRHPFQKGQGPMNLYERALRSVAKQVGNFIMGYTLNEPLTPDTHESLRQALRNYSELLGPWALHIVNNVLKQVDNQDKYAWQRHTAGMSVALRKQVQEIDVKDTFQELMRANVLLIKSIPLQAAQRVNRLVQANMMTSGRSSDLTKRIMETEGVTKTRATLIARTEVSKAGVALTQARATSIDSEGYIWHTTGDLIVRQSHKGMNGRFVRWAVPVTLDNMTGHAGCFPNCRCWPEPVFPKK